MNWRLFALVLLMVIMGQVRLGWVSWLKAYLREQWVQESRKQGEWP